MKQIGEVTALKGEFAEVVIKKESSCGENCASCGMCDMGKKRKALVYNECNAEVGERVSIYLESYKSVILALITYLLPLIIFFISFFIVKNELILASILIIAFFLCAYGANLIAKTKKFSSKAERKIREFGDDC